MKILLDTGHGGIGLSGYTTEGKRSPRGKNGVIFEGVSNRAFAYNIAYHLSLLGVSCEVVNAETNDVPLANRCKKINSLVATNPSKHLLVSIHSNAAPSPTNTFTTANGLEIYTHPKASELSVDCARHIGNCLIQSLPNLVWRYENWAINKTANFYILRHTICPAVLLEVLFMNGVQDYDLLTDPVYRVHIETAIVNALYTLATNAKTPDR